MGAGLGGPAGLCLYSYRITNVTIDTPRVYRSHRRRLPEVYITSSVDDAVRALSDG